MGIIAWIILGLIAAYVANLVVDGGRDTRGLVASCLIGVGGALLGGLAAVSLFDGDIGAFFNIATWIAAVAASAVALFAFNMITVRRSIHR